MLCVPLHGVSFSCACWSVNENGAVLTVQKRITQHTALTLVEYFLLRTLLIEHFLETENLARVRVRDAAHLNALVKNNLLLFPGLC